MRALYTIALVLFTITSYGQKSSLLQNVNVRARELKHKLNRTGDSLILSSEKVIEKVEIYNKNLERKFMVFDQKARIPLTNMPPGRYVTEVKLRGKLILITLLLEEDFSPLPSPVRTIVSSKPKEEKPEASHDLFGSPKRKRKINKKKSEKQEALRKIETTKKQDIVETLPTEKKDELRLAEKEDLTGTDVVASLESKNGNLSKAVANIKQIDTEKRVRFYWIIRNINKGTSSSKLMRIGERDVVDKMIEQNKIDLRSQAGKNNELTIWEVYDTTEFMKFKRKNPNYASVTEADCFNVVPFYRSPNNDDDF